MGKEKNYIVDVPIRGYYTYIVSARSKTEAIKKCRDESSPLDNIGIGEHFNKKWSMAQAKEDKLK